MSKKLKNVTGSDKKEVDLGGRPPVVLTEEQIAKVETLAMCITCRTDSRLFWYST